jgi:glycosyltransferase involved in cell wall biosynthesis
MFAQKNKTADYEVTVLVPVYNEEDNMPRLETVLASFLQKSAMPACILFINDGSRDRSGELIRKACEKHDAFFYLDFAENRGLSAALKAGIDHTRSRYVAYIDADLQTDPNELNLLMPHLGEFQLVTGVRANRKDTGFKKIQSRIANGFRRWVTGDGARDTGCPLKVMHTDMAQRLPFFTGMHRFFPALIQLEGGRVKQVNVSHFPRTAGVSKFSLRNRLIAPFMDCLVVRWMQKRHIGYRIADSDLKAE